MPTAVGVPTCGPSYRAPSQSVGLGRTQAHRRPVVLLPPLRPANHPALVTPPTVIAAPGGSLSAAQRAWSPRRLQYLPYRHRHSASRHRRGVRALGEHSHPQAEYRFPGSGSGQGRTADLPFFRRSVPRRAICYCTSPSARLICIDARHGLTGLPWRVCCRVPGNAVLSVGNLWETPPRPGLVGFLLGRAAAPLNLSTMVRHRPVATATSVPWVELRAAARHDLAGSVKDPPGQLLV